MRCSASVQGTWPTSQVFGGVIEKSCLSASGTACRLISRSSIANGWPSASCRQRSANIVRAAANAEARPVARRGRALAKLEQTVAVAFAAFFDLGLQIGNLQDRRTARAAATRSCRARRRRTTSPASASADSTLFTVMREQE